MRNLEYKDHSANEIHSRHIRDVVGELLRWDMEECNGESFESSNFEGKERIKRAFFTEIDIESADIKSILKFLLIRMKNDDGEISSLLSQIEEDSSVSTIPSVEQFESSEVFKKVFSGDYNEAIDSTEVADRSKVWMLAFYIYMHTNTDSKEEKIDALAHLLTYDNPEEDIHDTHLDIHYEALELEPELVELASYYMDRNAIRHLVIKKAYSIMQENETVNKDAVSTNLYLTRQASKLRVQSSDSGQPPRDSLAPSDDGFQESVM